VEISGPKRIILLDHEGKGSRILRYIGGYSSHNTQSHPRDKAFSNTVLITTNIATLACVLCKVEYTVLNGNNDCASVGKVLKPIT